MQLWLKIYLFIEKHFLCIFDVPITILSYWDIKMTKI